MSTPLHYKMTSLLSRSQIFVCTVYCFSHLRERLDVPNSILEVKLQMCTYIKISNFLFYSHIRNSQASTGVAKKCTNYMPDMM